MWLVEMLGRTGHLDTVKQEKMTELGDGLFVDNVVTVVIQLCSDIFPAAEKSREDVIRDDGCQVLEM